MTFWGKLPLGLSLALVISGCGENVFWKKREVAKPTPVEEVTVTKPEVVAPPKEAKTVEDFDTTTVKDRQEAVKVDQEAGKRLGQTVLSLGSPTEPGFWVKTPLVQKKHAGRVRILASGAAANVILMPIEGDGRASQISLAAMRVLKLGLTDLPEAELFLE